MNKSFPIFVLVIASGFGALAQEEDVAYRNEMSVKVKAATEAITSAGSVTAKIDEIKKLKSEVESEKSRIRKELDSAKDAKAPKEKLTRLDARDTEILQIHYSLEPVFEKSLSSSFAENGEFRRNACLSLPKTVEFNDMAALPEGASTPPSTALALDLIKALCEAKPATKK
jgi:hypothetical protein